MAYTRSNWAQHLQDHPSLLWLIERAPTLGILEELLVSALQRKEASTDTRRRWAEAAELRQFYLERCPPKFEPIGVVEAFGADAAADPRLKMSVADVIAQVLENRHFKCAEDGIFSFIGMGGEMPLDRYFNLKEFIPAAGYRPIERYYTDLKGQRQDNLKPSVDA